MNNLTFTADILFVVRVPVLSEQITVVLPSVSTLGNDRTMAFFLAISLVPILNVLNDRHLMLHFS
jgi:hypothetical protein